MMLDVRKRIQDHTNELIRQTQINSDIELDEEVEEIIKTIVSLAFQKGFIWGVNSVKQMSDVLLKDAKGEL